MPRFKCPDHWTLSQRIAVRTGAIEPSGCQFWLGATSNGYPSIRYKSVAYLVTRCVLEAHLGRPLLPGMYACHDYDQSLCISLNCLYEGTPEQNSHDCVSRGRHFTPKLKGEQHGMAALTEALVLEMRAALGSVAHRANVYSERLGVSRSTVYRAIEGSTWKHV